MSLGSSFMVVLRGIGISCGSSGLGVCMSGGLVEVVRVVQGNRGKSSNVFCVSVCPVYLCYLTSIDPVRVGRGLCRSCGCHGRYP